MTNNLQQAYDRAMAHNALLREALHDLYTEHPSTTWSEDVYVLKALNATDADATAWKCEIEKVIIQKFTQSIFEAHKEAWEEKVQQLATVTQERNALREALKISTSTVGSLSAASLEATTTIAKDRDCALAHVATMVERLERLVCLLKAPAFLGQNRGSSWHSSYTYILNDIGTLIKKTKPETLPLLESLKHSAKLDVAEKFKIETETKLLMEALHPDLMALREVALEESRVRLQKQMEQVCLDAAEAKKEGQQC